MVGITDGQGLKHPTTYVTSFKIYVVQNCKLSSIREVVSKKIKTCTFKPIQKDLMINIFYLFLFFPCYYTHIPTEFEGHTLRFMAQARSALAINLRAKIRVRNFRCGPRKRG